MRDEEINRAIDRAVREMLAVEPPADLRARVIGRIDRPAASGLRWIRLGAPIAAVALVVISLVLWLSPRHAPEPAAVQSARYAPSARPPEPARRDTSTFAPRERSVAHVESTQAPRQPRVRVAIAANVEGSETGEIAPLEPIAPIHVAAVASTDIAPPPIAIEPLAPIAEVRIAPLTPPDGRQ